MLPSVWRRDVSRLHRNAGIHGDPHIVHLDLAARAIDRNLGNACGERVVLHHGGDAKRRIGALAFPIRHLGDFAQQVLHARRAFGNGEPELDRVLAEILCDFVEEAFDRKRVVAIADATPRRQPRTARHDDVFGKLIGDRILRNG